LVLPAKLSADYSFRQIDVVRSLAEPWALAGVGFVVAGALALAWSWRRSPVAFVCLALAGASYVVVSNVLVPTGSIFAERFVYLPSAGVCALLAMAAVRAAGRSRAVVATVVVATLVWWSGVTWARNRIWRDPTSFAEALVREAPRSAHAHHVLATTLAGRGLEDAALEEFDRALAIDPGNAGSLFNSAVILRRKGRTDEAAARWTRATEADPGHVQAWLNLSLLRVEQERFDEALAAADRGVALHPHRADTLTTRAIALRGLGRPAEARAAVARALVHRPGEPRALAELAELALEAGDDGVADAALAKLAATAPRKAYASVVAAYAARGRGDEAAAIVARATVATRRD
jgi:tetratricopeptide (TPR) repeat protein